MGSKLWLRVGLATSMVASFALVGCGGSTNTATPSTGTDTAKKSEPQEINLLLGDEVPTMDVSKATDSIGFLMFNQVNEGLTRLDKDGKAIPGVAKDWKVSDDKLTYTFNLRSDAKWSDGSPVTAKDFEYSWKRTLDPKTKGQYSFMVAWVKGGTAYNEGKGKVDDVAVKALNDTTLEVKLETPKPFFLEQMAFPTFYPQKKEFVDKMGDKYGADADKVLYNGPFKMDTWVHGQQVVLTKNDNYWNKDSVKLTKATFQIVKDTAAAVNLYETGQTDRTSLTRDFVDQYKSKPDFHTAPVLGANYFQYNQVKHDFFKNAKIRKAILWAIDRDKYADLIFHNGTVGSTGWVPAGTSNGAGGDFRKDNGDLIGKHTADDAKKLLAEGLKEVNLTALPKMTLLLDDGDLGKKAGEFLKEQLRTNLGYDINVENVPFKTRLKKTDDGQFDIVLSSWFADYNDPMTFMDMWVTGGPFNESKYSNKQYDDLIAKAQKELDPTKRMGYMKDAEKILMNDMGIGPIVFRGSAYVLKPYVKNMFARSFGPDYDLSIVYIEGKK